MMNGYKWKDDDLEVLTLLPSYLTNIAVQHCSCIDDLPVQMVIFRPYVGLPEGIPYDPLYIISDYPCLSHDNPIIYFKP